VEVSNPRTLETKPTRDVTHSHRPAHAIVLVDERGADFAFKQLRRQFEAHSAARRHSYYVKPSAARRAKSIRARARQAKADKKRAGWDARKEARG